MAHFVLVLALTVSCATVLAGPGEAAASGPEDSMVGAAVAATPAESGELVVGAATLVHRSESLPYSYAYYVPESARGGADVRVVAVALEGSREETYEYAEWKALGEVGALTRHAQSASFVAFCVAVPMPEGDTAYPEDSGSGSVGYARMLEATNFLSMEVDSFYYRPDLKFISALEDLWKRLTAGGVAAARRIFLMGFSAGGGWACRFPALHPDLVAASAVVASYVLTMPLADCAGVPQHYPRGVCDLDRLGVRSFDIEAYRSIAFLVVAGTREAAGLRSTDLLPASAATPEEVRAYINAYGATPARQAASFADQLQSLGMRCELLVGPWGHEFPWAARQRAIAFLLSVPVR